MGKYDSMLKADLESAARDRGLDDTGTVAELTARLEEADQASDATESGDGESVELSTKKVLAVINDGEDDPDTADALQTALFRFGAQDPSRELPRSWQRVQRRIGVDSDKLNGIATAEQVAQFADRAGLTLTK